MWLITATRGVLRRYINEDGQAEAFLIALAISLLILILAGRRIVVQ